MIHTSMTGGFRTSFHVTYSLSTMYFNKPSLSELCAVQVGCLYAVCEYDMGDHPRLETGMQLVGVVYLELVWSSYKPLDHLSSIGLQILEQFLELVGGAPHFATFQLKILYELIGSPSKEVRVLKLVERVGSKPVFLDYCPLLISYTNPITVLHSVACSSG